jgi:hypothetical protein
MTTRFPLRSQVIISRPVDLVCLIACPWGSSSAPVFPTPTASRTHASFNLLKIGFFFLLLLRVLCSNRFRFLPSADSGRNASLEDARKGGGDASVSGASAAVGGKGEEDDATGGAAGLRPPVPSQEPANSTQESGVLSKLTTFVP